MLRFSVFVLLLGLCCVSARIALPSEDGIIDEQEELLVDELEEYIETGETKENLRSLQANDNIMKNLFRSGFKRVKDNTICLLCRAAARILIGYRQMGATKEDLSYAANQICIGAKISTKNVCEGAIKLNIDIFLYIIDHKKDISPTRVCTILAQSTGCIPAEKYHQQWKVKLAPKPTTVTPIVKQTSDTPIRVLHFTDIHYDDIYKVGGNAVCDEPLCCGANQGVPTGPETAAGAWGDYRYCDTPWHAVLDMVNETSRKEYDVVYYTGDTINHRVWATTIESNIRNIKKVNSVLRDAFKSVPFFPILGNHEPSPLDVFSPTNITRPDVSTQWLFDLAADEWSAWLPNSTQETIRRGGFYTALVKPGFRIIALNSNVAYTYNWWLLYNDVDPFGQLQWMADTLAEAEKAGEMVHILSHVPAGDDTCLKSWSHEFNKIIQRFSENIAIQINGHTHYDEFEVFYSKETPDKPISVALNGGSVTTYYSLNPNYRIMTVNPNNFKVEDYEEWIFNITDANLHGVDVSPVWFKLYSFKEAWGINDMTNFTEIDRVVKNIAKDPHTFEQYFRFKVREGDPFMLEGCDKSCQEDNICRLVTTEYADDKKCNELLQHSFLKKRGRKH